MKRMFLIMLGGNAKYMKISSTVMPDKIQNFTQISLVPWSSGCGIYVIGSYES
jgi:hypothetical protein